MRKKIDLSGQRIGKWSIVNRDHLGKDGAVFWNCICDCGNQSVVKGSNLLRGGSLSCGCLQIAAVKTHGMTRTPTARSWEAMKQRCLNPNAPDFPRYGKRGITICDRWVNSFQNFLDDMGVRPEGMTLDRHPDNKGNYEPSNCRWATLSEQQRNKTTTNMIEYLGELKSASDWAQEFGLSAKVVKERIAVGWSVEDALNKTNRKAKK